ncbi:MAG: adenylyl-sulfate kinase [Actinomycetota bacterium]|nr:adenylyl-sulfate kinase [Actinomycetota bacterium]
MSVLTGSPAAAVLITGVFGSGKSSVGMELADLLEQRRAPYALLDLDFLSTRAGAPGRRSTR